MAWPKGQPRSKETKRKTSESCQKAWVARKKRGWKWTRKSRKKLSNAIKALWKNGQPHPMLGKMHSEETKRHWSEMRKGVPLSETTKAKLRKSQQRRWQRPEEHEKVSKAHKKRFAKGGPDYMHRARAVQALYLQNPPKCEVMVQQELQRRRIKFEAQVIFLGRYAVDILIRRRHLVIECDGQHRTDHNKKRDRDLMSQGLRVVHLPNKEIKKNVVAAIERALQCP
jgi:very-short-patch-repair endonuclease